MPFLAEAYTEVDIYTTKWQALLDHVHSGLGLRDQLRATINEWGRKVHPEPKGGKDLESRTEVVRAKVEAMVARFGPVLGTISVWYEALKPHLTSCSANLDGLPLPAAIDGVHMAFSRAQRRTLPPCPPVSKLDSIEQLEARVRWLREVGEAMPQVEASPQEVGAALRFLEETLGRFEAELEYVKGRGRNDNTSALRWHIPVHPLGVQSEPRPRPAPRKDELEWLYR
jgi:hypothetical protein